MKAALDAKIQADAGGTDYNAAFNTGRAANPGARARSFGSGLSRGEDQARLAKIASDTGGKYFPLPDSSALQSVMNQIETTLTCQSPPTTFSDALAPGKTRAYGVTISPKSTSVQLAASWTSPLDRFKISGLTIVRDGKVVATATSARKRRLRVRVRKGSTFHGGQGLPGGQGQAALQGKGDEDRLGRAQGDAHDPGQPESPLAASKRPRALGASCFSSQWLANGLPL